MRFLSNLACVAALIAAILPALADPAITVDQPWARATPAGARTGAVYMTVHNTASTEDRLTGAASDVAAVLQIHEMTVVNGTMQMRQLADGLPIPAGGTAVLKPGSYHVMLMGLKNPLTAGETFPLVLNFEKAGKVPVTVKVEPLGAAQPDSAGGTQGGHEGMGSMEMK